MHRKRRKNEKMAPQAPKKLKMTPQKPGKSWIFDPRKLGVVEINPPPFGTENFWGPAEKGGGVI